MTNVSTSCFSSYNCSSDYCFSYFIQSDLKVNYCLRYIGDDWEVNVMGMASLQGQGHVGHSSCISLSYISQLSYSINLHLPTDGSISDMFALSAFCGFGRLTSYVSFLLLLIRSATYLKLVQLYITTAAFSMQRIENAAEIECIYSFLWCYLRA